MKPDEENGHVQNIGEWVLDEDKIVTYKWLSKTLSVHINTAKQLLFRFLSERKNKSPSEVSATYLLAGKSKDGIHRVTVVDEDDLETARDDFREITAEHVYSVQKIRPVKDFQVLYRADKSGSNPDSFDGPVGPVKCSKSFLRSKNESSTRRLGRDGGKPVCESPKEDPKEIEGADDRKKTGDSGKGAEKPKGSKAASAARETSKEKKPAANAKKGGNIADFFGNAGASKKTKPKEETGTNVDRSERTAANGSADKIRPPKSAPKIETKSDPLAEPSSKSKKNVESEGKKRKRIKVFSDSEESETESSKERSPSPMIVDEDEAESEKKTPVVQENITDSVHEETSQNKRKKRKVVDRTVMSEDGYIETKKEVVYETDSESEEKPEEKRKVEPVRDPPKRTSPRKGKSPAENSNTKQAGNSKKQSSLYSFFKKN